LAICFFSLTSATIDRLLHLLHVRNILW
jgi:hypothetical protein